MKTKQNTSKSNHPFKNLKSTSEIVKKVSSFLSDFLSDTTFFPVPVVIIELEIPPTSNGLFYYSSDAIDILTNRFFDFKDSSMEREFQSSKIFKCQQFWNDELYSVPALRISYVILGGDFCGFSHYKLEQKTHSDLLENVGVSGIYYQFTSDNYNSLVNSVTSPFPENYPINLNSFNKLEHNYVNLDNILHIYKNPIDELNPKELFSNQ